MEARQPAEGIGAGVSVGVASSVLEELADEDVLEPLSDEELGVVSMVLDWLNEEDTIEEELGTDSDELEGLRAVDRVAESAADVDTLEDWVSDALDDSNED